MITALFLAHAISAVPLTLEHAECMVIASKEYEKSGEPAETVATAVISRCAPLEPHATPENILGQMTAKDREEVVDEVHSALRREIIRYVVEYRACKSSKGCRANSVEPVAPSRALEFLAGKAPIR